MLPTPLSQNKNQTSVAKILVKFCKPVSDIKPESLLLQREIFHLGTSLVVQWLRLHAPNAEGLGSIPDPGTRSPMPQLRACVPQLKIPHAAMKIPHTEMKMPCAK